MKDIKRKISSLTLYSRFNKIEILIIIYNHLTNTKNNKTKTYNNLIECFGVIDQVDKENLIECFKDCFIYDANNKTYILNEDIELEELDNMIYNFRLRVEELKYKREIAKITK